jgi:formate dehydrogenase assembly factor FdhD
MTLFIRNVSNRKRLFNKVETNCTALVVYGSNLSSTVGFSITKKVRMITALPSHIEQLLTGLLLSDGYLRLKDVKMPLLNSHNQ